MVRCCFIVLVAWAGLLQPIHAAPSEPRATKPAPTMSRPEVRACVLLEDEVNRRQTTYASAKAEHEAELARAGLEALALAEVLRTLDMSNEYAVDTYNQRNDARNAVVTRINQRAEALNQISTQLNAEGADHLVRCASRPYLSVDRDAVLKELGRPPGGKPPSRAPPPSRGSLTEI